MLQRVSMFVSWPLTTAVEAVKAIYHNHMNVKRRDYGQLIIQESCMTHVFGGKSHLVAAGAHSESHGIHVDEAWKRLQTTGVRSCLQVLIQGNLNFDLAAATESDILTQSLEASVIGYDPVVREDRLRILVVCQVMALALVIGKVVVADSQQRKGADWQNRIVWLQHLLN